MYNWLVDFFIGHSHCTFFCDQTSEFESVTDSIIQGSAIGPAAYVVNAGDLTRSLELHNIQLWTQYNNLKLNCTKSCEVVFTDPKRRRQPVPPGTPGIYRREKPQMMGVTPNI